MALYRLTSPSDETSLARFVPVLIPTAATTAPSITLSGLSIIVRMGSIGVALAPVLLAAGSTAVVFLGWKPIDHPEVNVLLLLLLSISYTI
jgi:hypothetical protein